MNLRHLELRIRVELGCPIKGSCNREPSTRNSRRLLVATAERLKPTSPIVTTTRSRAGLNHASDSCAAKTKPPTCLKMITLSPEPCLIAAEPVATAGRSTRYRPHRCPLLGELDFGLGLRGFRSNPKPETLNGVDSMRSPPSPAPRRSRPGGRPRVAAQPKHRGESPPMHLEFCFVKGLFSVAVRV